MSKRTYSLFLLGPTTGLGRLFPIDCVDDGEAETRARDLLQRSPDAAGAYVCEERRHVAWLLRDPVGIHRESPARGDSDLFADAAA